MSKYLEYNNYIIKISNKVLKTFENYSIEDQTKAHLKICKEIYNFVMIYNIKYDKYKMNIINNNITYFDGIIDFSKYDKKFREKIINKVIIYLNNNDKINNDKINNEILLFSKLQDIIED